MSLQSVLLATTTGAANRCVLRQTAELSAAAPTTINWGLTKCLATVSYVPYNSYNGLIISDTHFNVNPASQR